MTDQNLPPVYTVLPNGFGQIALLVDGIEVYVADTYTECLEHAITIANNLTS